MNCITKVYRRIQKTKHVDEYKATTSSGAGIGRPCESPIWAYFIYSEEEKSICQIPISEDKLCGKNFSGKFMSNLKQHLRK